jgi:50S ribosome-binding GTPase
MTAARPPWQIFGVGPQEPGKSSAGPEAGTGSEDGGPEQGDEPRRPGPPWADAAVAEEPPNAAPPRPVPFRSASLRVVQPKAAPPWAESPPPEPPPGGPISPGPISPGPISPGPAAPGPVTPATAMVPPPAATGPLAQAATAWATGAPVTAEPLAQAAAGPVTARPAPAIAGPVTAGPTASATTGPVAAGTAATATARSAAPATGPAAPVTAGPPWDGPDAGPGQAGPPAGRPAKAVPPWEMPEAEPAKAGPPWEAPAEAEAERPWTGLTPAEVPRPGLPGAGLSARLTALARLIQIASARADGGFSEELLSDANDLVDRAGERLRLSAGHTVVALAGGTGSGKSTLFNKLAGHDFSAVGVTRPVTRDAHACVWGAAGSGSLLEWLAVPRRYRYTRGSALDGGEAALNGLVLLDLPDHDSVVTGAANQVDRLVGMADLMVWVLDPQKYADAAVHRRYLVPLASHSGVIAVVLNQADVLSPVEAEECVTDLRRLLDSEGLQNAPMLVTSAVTGTGIDLLRSQLAGAVTARRAASARLSADVDDIAARFAPHAGQGPPHRPGQAGRGRSRAQADTMAVLNAGRVPAESSEQLAEAFSRAAGVSAVADALDSARELRAVDYVGWPVAWLADRIASGRDPVRKVRLGKLWADLRSMSAGPSGAQQADIDKALTKLADEVGPPLPRPWSQTVRAAVRSRAEEIPAALGTVMGESLPPEDKIMPWWRVIGALQGLLLGCVIVSLAWILALLVFGVFHVVSSPPRLFGDASLLPWIVVMIAAFLILGWLIASGCMNIVRAAAEREREQVQQTMRTGIAAVARDMVVIPTEQELAEFGRFRSEYQVAAGR